MSLIPKPDIVISLVARPETIHTRKPELNIDEITDRIIRARTLERYGVPVAEISAEPPLDVVIQSVRAAIRVRLAKIE